MWISLNNVLVTFPDVTKYPDKSSLREKVVCFGMISLGGKVMAVGG